MEIGAGGEKASTTQTLGFLEKCVFHTLRVQHVDCIMMVKPRVHSDAYGKHVAVVHGGNVHHEALLDGEERAG